MAKSDLLALIDLHLIRERAETDVSLVVEADPLWQGRERSEIDVAFVVEADPLWQGR